MATLSALVGEAIGLFTQDKTEIDGLVGVVDLYPEENHSLTVTKTKFPVQSGKKITDNAVVEPYKLTLQGLVSDLHPLLGGIITIPGAGRIPEAWQRVLDLAKAREPLTVVTTLGVFENMLIGSADANVSADTGKGLVFNMSLEEIIIDQLEVVALPKEQLSGPAANKSSAENGGLKQSEQSDSSLLKSSIRSLSNWYNN